MNPPTSKKHHAGDAEEATTNGSSFQFTSSSDFEDLIILLQDDSDTLLDDCIDDDWNETRGLVAPSLLVTELSALPAPFMLPPHPSQHRCSRRSQNLETNKRPPLPRSVAQQQGQLAPAIDNADGNTTRSFPRQSLASILRDRMGNGERPTAAFLSWLARNNAAVEVAALSSPPPYPERATSMDTIGSIGTVGTGGSLGTIGSISSLQDIFMSIDSVDHDMGVNETDDIVLTVPVSNRCLNHPPVVPLPTPFATNYSDGDDHDLYDDSKPAARPKHTAAKSALNRNESFNDVIGNSYNPIIPSSGSSLTASVAKLAINGLSDSATAGTMPPSSPHLHVTPPSPFVARYEKKNLPNWMSSSKDAKQQPSSHAGATRTSLPSCPESNFTESSHSSSSSSTDSDEESEGGQSFDQDEMTRCTPNTQTCNPPTDLDVTFGRGGGSNHHPGNKTYLNHILSLQEEYKKMSRENKTRCSQGVVDWVHQRGGRFLQRRKGNHSSGWYEASNVDARTKVSQALRQDHTAEGREKKRKNQKKRCKSHK
jgi:hypothetical protein